MKTNKLIVLALAVGLAIPAQARMIDSADNVGYSYQGDAEYRRAAEARPALDNADKKETSLWSKVQAVAVEATATAKTKVNELMGFFGLKPQPAPNRQVASEPAPVTTPTPALPAPVAQAPTPTMQPAPVVSEEHAQFAQVLKQTKEQLSGKDAIVVANPGRAAGTVLPQSKLGVPVFALQTKETKKDKKTGKTKSVTISVKDIPRLDIGLERTISKNDFLPVDAKVNLKIKQKVTTLATPALTSQKDIKKLQARPLPVVAKAKSPTRGEFQLGQLVSQKKIDAVSLDMVPTKPLEALKAYEDIDRDQLNMIMAVILYKKKDKCHLASGLLYELATKKAMAEEANFYLGVCAHQMGFHSEAVNRLLRVVEAGQSEYLTEAITSLAEDLPAEHNARVATALKGLKSMSVVAPEAQDNVHYIVARAAHERGNFGEALEFAGKVSEKSAHYASSQYIRGIGLYGDKRMKEAEQSLLDLRAWMAKKGKIDKNIEALIAVNLARMRFTQGRYQAAHEEYMRVPKDSPHWVQALIEQGWTQLSIDDPEGAIGNMYSLHSPYFKSVFMPESWVVRTIGYIDICQYGDAYRTLSRLEQLHGGWLAAVDKYMKSHATPSEYYATVKNYIKGRSDANTDGLPFQIVREIARQRGFLNAQNALNVLEDEIAQYGFIFSLVKKEQAETAFRSQQAKARIATLKANIAKSKATADYVKNLNEWNAQVRNEEALVKYYQFQASLYERARAGYVAMRTDAVARLEKDKGRLRTVAGKELISHLRDIHNRVSQIVEGNEFLRYEIFSGSGENIRYQVAGGSTSDAKRIPAHVKPQKILNWEFDGEYWEDEIGSYRSTLKNNCPKTARAANTTGTGYTASAKGL